MLCPDRRRCRSRLLGPHLAGLGLALDQRNPAPNSSHAHVSETQIDAQDMKAGGGRKKGCWQSKIDRKRERETQREKGKVK